MMPVPLVVAYLQDNLIVKALDAPRFEYGNMRAMVLLTQCCRPLKTHSVKGDDLSPWNSTSSGESSPVEFKRRRTGIEERRFTEEQVIGGLREAECGVKVADLWSGHGISEAPFLRAHSAATATRRRTAASLDALHHLAELRDEGNIREVALTNFDTQRMQDIANHGVRVVSNQVQYSLVDRRPEVAMAGFCQENEVSLLAYGTVCGGLLSDRYLGSPEPGPATLNTASLRKYKQMIDAWGGWELFQRLLTTLRTVADRHDASIANVAVR